MLPEKADRSFQVLPEMTEYRPRVQSSEGLVTTRLLDTPHSRAMLALTHVRYLSLALHLNGKYLLAWWGIFPHGDGGVLLRRSFVFLAPSCLLAFGYC